MEASKSFEIHVNRPESISDFYKNVFGWEVIRRHPQNNVWEMRGSEDGLWVSLARGRKIKNLPTGNEKVSLDGPYLITIEVENTQIVRESILEQGGGCLPDDIWQLEGGKLTFCSDPAGNIFGIFETDRPSATRPG